MDYKISKFILAEPENADTMVLYSTLTTSIVKLSTEIYNEIFKNKNFIKYTDEVKKLSKMGFIIPTSFDENNYLANVRKKSMTAMNNMGTPYYLITPTMDCNARCYYCFEHGSHHDKMSLSTANNVVSFIKKNAPNKDIVIQWFGGEPLLATDIIDYISESLKKDGYNIKSKITTNGYLLTDKVISHAISEWGTDVIQITLDGLNEEYNKIKNYTVPNKDKAFDIVIANIKSVLNSGIKLRIRINFDPLNQEPAVKIIKYLNSRFGKYSNLYVYFAPIDSKKIPAISGSFEELDEHPLISMLNIKEEFAGMAQTHRGITDLNELQLNKYYLHPISLSCTGVCNRNVTIDSHGDLYVCHRLLGKGDEYSSGNVVDGFIDNEIRRKYQSTDLIDSKCNNCNLLPLCQGGCKYRRFTYSDENACMTVKSIAGKLLLRALSKIDSPQN